MPRPRPSDRPASADVELGRPTARTIPAGRLKTVSDPLTRATLTYGYDTASRLTSVTYGGTGAICTLGYDVLDRPVSDELKSPTGTVTTSTAYT